MGIQKAIRKVSQHEHLTQEEAHAAMGEIMNGAATPAQIGGYLMALRMKGETVEEITGSARAMREAANHAPVQTPNVIDTCGTGGDASNTFNISTTVAFVAAGGGIPVAKHGNRAASSKSGSADVLAALGVNIGVTPEQAAQCVDAVGIGFLFAATFHPAMRHAIGPRRELGIRTIFNILGPLTNPAGARRQVMGVFSESLTQTLAEVLKELGSESVFVVHGAGGLDEMSTLGATHVSQLQAGQVETYEIEPSKLGLKQAAIEDILGGTPEENAYVTRELLSGRGTTAQREIVMLNAAAAFVVAGITSTLEDGLQKSAQVMDSGKGLEKLEALVHYSQQFAPEAKA
ncbi:MAG: anthranilate phosphoribosyltransferase [Chloroflexi bacterium]|nr:anthranilate phosphoribosyltransferase [Chloroflexota bacterium]